MKIYCKKYTIGASTVISKTSEDLMNECSRLNLPAKAVYFTGDNAFVVWLNHDEQQKIECMATPFRTPIIPVNILSFKIVGTNTKVVSVHLFYKAMKGAITGRPIERGEQKKT